MFCFFNFSLFLSLINEKRKVGMLKIRNQTPTNIFILLIPSESTFNLGTALMKEIKP